MNDELNLMENPVEETAAETPVEETTAVSVEPVKAPRERSTKYVAARSMVDRTITYPAEQAIELVKASSYTKFVGTVTAHINLKKELSKQVEVIMPFATGKSLRVAIVNDEVLAQITEGVLNFDVLVTTPAMMPKLAKFARVLGPKGLMPNPKNGTVTNDPEAKKKLLEGGAVSVKAERKAPLIHERLGKVNQPTEELVANLQALIAAVGVGNIAKITLAASMSPGVKVTVE